MKLLMKRILGHTLQAPLKLLTKMSVVGSKLVCNNKTCKVLRPAKQGKVTRRQAVKAVKAVTKKPKK